MHIQRVWGIPISSDFQPCKYLFVRSNDHSGPWHWYSSHAIDIGVNLVEPAFELLLQS